LEKEKELIKRDSGGRKMGGGAKEIEG